jgi:hypothetical protein
MENTCMPRNYIKKSIIPFNFFSVLRFQNRKTFPRICHITKKYKSVKVYIFLIVDFLKIKSRTSLNQILDGNWLKAITGLIPAPNSGSFIEK